MRAHFTHLCSKAFQWYKELFNPMNFDFCNRFLKIWNSLGILTPEVKAPLGVCGFIPSHPPTLPGAWNVTPGLHYWPTPLQVFALVTSTRLRSQQIQWVKTWCNIHQRQRLKYKNNWYLNFGGFRRRILHKPKVNKTQEGSSLT
jgi:hypothetical protein